MAWANDELASQAICLVEQGSLGGDFVRVVGPGLGQVVAQSVDRGMQFPNRLAQFLLAVVAESAVAVEMEGVGALAPEAGVAAGEGGAGACGRAILDA
ncbi:hypothetical protein [Streptomyces phaeochromogenes]|uniref:hypothetical protein n=1 Tax=Streptomyces phaeochromogenes TaxID=1923 RepID=UPI0038684402|nr:hypothetical protein OHB08_42435 [Streptomyces phaeochromogenes]